MTTPSLALGGLAFVLIVACRRHQAAPVASTARLVPKARTPITIDGAWSEPDWNDLALTGDFVGDDGQPARPVSQIRLLADEQRLLIGLYAADEDIRSNEFFEVAVGPSTFHFDPLGHVTPQPPGVHSTVDTDGTLDKPDDNDEEWVIEADLTLSVAGLLPPGISVPVRASRCDVTKDGVRRCGTWSQSIQLAVP